MRWYLLSKALGTGRCVRQLALIVVTCLLITPLSAQALGLGDIVLLSEQNQPLVAEIQLVAVRPGELDGLSISLASPVAFARAGIKLSPILADVRFAAGQRAGKPVIQVLSSLPIDEPALEFIVQAEWSTGRMVREYAIVLDPSAATLPDSIPTTTPPSIELAVDEQTADSIAPVRNPTNNLSIESRDSNVFPSNGKRELTVESGDTLYIIASENAVPGVSVQQMMMALLNANKDSFIDGNINLVKVDAVLRMPDKSELIRLSQGQVVQQVREQSDLWQEYRDSILQTTGNGALANQLGIAQQPPLPKLSASAQRILEQAKNEAQRTRELNIVGQNDSIETDASATANNNQNTDGARLGNLNRKIQFAVEELASTRLARMDLAEQSGELKDTLDNLNSLVSIRQDEFDRLQGVLRRALDDQAIELAAQAQADALAAAQVDTPPATEIVEIVADAEQEIEPLVEPLAQQVSWYVSVSRSVGDWLFVGIGVLSVIGLFLLLSRESKRRKSVDKALANTGYAENPLEHEGDVENLASAPNDIAIGESGNDAVSVPAIEYDETMIEVEAYLAHGLPDVAEELLAQAIVLEPDNDAYTLKLLEIQQETGTGDTLAQAEADYHTEYTDYSGDDAAYSDDVSSMAYDLDSVNTLFDMSTSDEHEIGSGDHSAVVTDGEPTAEPLLADSLESENFVTDDDTDYNAVDGYSAANNDAPVDENSSAKSDVTPANATFTEPTLQHKIVSSLFLGWCALAWMPQITSLGGSDIGLAQIVMVAIVFCLWRIEHFGSVGVKAYGVRLLIYACCVFMIGWAALALFNISELLGSGRLFLSLFQGLVVLYLVTAVLSLDTLKRSFQLCAGMAVLSVLLCVFAQFNSGLEALLFNGTGSAVGLFKNSSQFGLVLAMAVPAAVLLFFSGRHTMLSVILLVSLFWGLDLSGSKTNIVVLVGMLFFVVLFAVAASRHRIVLSLTFACLAIFVLITGFPLLEVINPRVNAIVQEFITHGGSGEDAVKQRNFLWDYSINAIANHPFFGEGQGLGFLANGELTDHSHNVFLNYGRTVGIPAAVSMFIVLVASLVFVFRTLKMVMSKPQTMSIVLLAGACFSIITYIVSIQMSDSFGSVSSFFFWLSLGLVLRRRELIMPENVFDSLVASESTDRRLLDLFDTPVNPSGARP